MIQIDTREHEKERLRIQKQFDALGIEYVLKKVDEGDYISDRIPGVSVDRKKNLAELAYNCGRDCTRYCAEIRRAADKGVHLIFLCENGGSIRELADVRNWKNPRLAESPLAISGERLHKIMSSISRKYGCEYRFCRKSETGRVIAELLGEIETVKKIETGGKDIYVPTKNKPESGG